MNTDNQNKSFYELVTEYKIQIPIIQRDYAQGRNANNQICEKFLSTILDAIKGNYPIYLDFIYGNVTNNIFFPLDGQQRLTTLFLLHWYAYLNLKNPSDEIKTTLKKFSYETRLSSRRFCNALIDNISFDIDKNSTLSNTIKDLAWYETAWDKDPTIRAMLNTIDIINRLFKNVDLWESLVDNKIVKFHLLILEDFGLSDDLYIKMNARGKILTSFEHLKAELEDKINKNNWDNDKNELEKFYIKIDGDWTSFIWDKFYNIQSKDNDIAKIVDNAYMNFIFTIIMIQTAISDKKIADKEDIIRKINEGNCIRQAIEWIDKNVYDYLFKCFNIYLNNATNIPQIAFNIWENETKIHELTILEHVLKGNSTYAQKVLFFAQTEYLLNNPIIDEEKFLDWIRVARNIIFYSIVGKDAVRVNIINNLESFCDMLNFIHELAQGSHDIYAFLCSSYNKNNCKFASNLYFEEKLKNHISEEILKAHIICEKKEYKQLLFNLEDNELLRGKISYCFKYAGCTSIADNENYQNKIDEINFDLLEKIQVVFRKYFNENLDNYPEKFDLLRRVMLTIEVNNNYYQFYDYWWSWWNQKEIKKRKLFPKYRELEHFIYYCDYSYFEKLIKSLIDNDLETIIAQMVQVGKPTEMPNWQYRLIKEKNLLLEKCVSKYIAIPEDNSYCYLLKSQRPSTDEGSHKIE